MSTWIGLSVFVEQFLTFGETESKVLSEPESLIFYPNKSLPVFSISYIIDSTFVTDLYLFLNKPVA